MRKGVEPVDIEKASDKDVDIHLKVSELDTPVDSGQARLHALGYRQELRRSFGAFTSFAVSLVLMANSSGITGGWQLLLLLCQPLFEVAVQQGIMFLWA